MWIESATSRSFTILFCVSSMTNSIIHSVLKNCSPRLYVIMARFLISLVVLGVLTVTMCELLKERMQLVNTFLSHQNLPRCSQTETGQFFTCAIKNVTDARAMTVLIDSCGNEQHVQECPYGSTCVMLSCNEKGDVSYDCLCHSAKRSQSNSATYTWSRWSPFSHSRVFGFSRELKDTSVTDPPILAREYRYTCSQRIK